MILASICAKVAMVTAVVQYSLAYMNIGYSYGHCYSVILTSICAKVAWSLLLFDTHMHM